MSDLDLFGEAIKEEKKPAKKQASLSVAPRVNSRSDVDYFALRPCTVQRLSKTSVLIINTDCRHLFA